MPRYASTVHRRNNTDGTSEFSCLEIVSAALRRARQIQSRSLSGDPGWFDCGGAPGAGETLMIYKL